MSLPTISQTNQPFTCTKHKITVMVDEQQFRRVLDNLLDNALRHSELKTGEREAHLVISASPRAISATSTLSILRTTSQVLTRPTVRAFHDDR